jgi:hypothetical protein
LVETGTAQSVPYSDQVLGWTTQRSNSRKGKRYLFSPLNPEQHLQWASGFLPWGKVTRVLADYTLESSTEAKNEWSNTSNPPTCLYGMESDKFTCFLHLVNMFIKI